MPCAQWCPDSSPVFFIWSVHVSSIRPLTVHYVLVSSAPILKTEAKPHKLKANSLLENLLSCPRFPCFTFICPCAPLAFFLLLLSPILLFHKMMSNVTVSILCTLYHSRCLRAKCDIRSCKKKTVSLCLSLSFPLKSVWSHPVWLISLSNTKIFTFRLRHKHFHQSIVTSTIELLRYPVLSCFSQEQTASFLEACQMFWTHLFSPKKTCANHVFEKYFETYIV